jgi:hypothetical protein
VRNPCGVMHGPSALVTTIGREWGNRAILTIRFTNPGAATSDWTMTFNVPAGSPNGSGNVPAWNFGLTGQTVTWAVTGGNTLTLSSSGSNAFRIPTGTTNQQFLLDGYDLPSSWNTDTVVQR